jgi:hypothetical protein
MSSLGEALERGIVEKNESLKNAALFTIMQNPKARLLINGDELSEPNALPSPTPTDTPAPQ